MPWVPLDIHWYQDAKVEAAGEQAGPIALAAFSVLLAMAKAQANGGRVEFTYRSLSHALFTERPAAEAAVEALVSAGVLSCPQVSAGGGVVAFNPEAWRRRNESMRKAFNREGKGEGESA